MTRPLTVLSIAVMLTPPPRAEAKKRVKHSHVLACAALVGAPCQGAHSLARTHRRLGAHQGDEQMVALKLRRKRRLGLVTVLVAVMALAACDTAARYERDAEWGDAQCQGSLYRRDFRELVVSAQESEQGNRIR